MSLARTLANTRQLMAKIVAFLACAYMVLIVFTNVPFFIDVGATGQIYGPRLLQILVLMAILVAMTQPGKIIPFLKTPAAAMSAGISIIFLFNWLRLPYMVEHIEPYLAEVTLNRLERFIIFPCASFIVFCVRTKTIERLLLVAIVLVPIPLFLDFFYPELHPAFEPDRAAGTYLNANQAGEGLLLWLVLVQNRLKGWLFLLVFVFSGLALLLTFSRAGMVGFLLLGAYFIYRQKLPKISIAVPILVIVFYSTLLIQAENILTVVVDNEGTIASMMDRLSFVSDIGTEEAIDDDSSESRIEVVEDAIKAIAKKPIAGYAMEPEFALFIPTHNFFIESWYTYGILGLVIFFWLVRNLYLAGLQRNWRWINPYLMLFLWFTPFDHQHLTSLYWVIFYAIVMKPSGAAAFANKSANKLASESEPLSPKRRSRSSKNSRWRL